MPYKLQGNCVVTLTGETVKCHKNRARAISHLVALKINVPEARQKEVQLFQKWSSDQISLLFGLKAFNPSQPRFPKGHPQGGMWRGGRGGVAEQVLGAGLRVGGVGSPSARAGMQAGISGVRRVSPGVLRQVRGSGLSPAPGGRVGYAGVYNPRARTITIHSLNPSSGLSTSHEFGHAVDHLQFGRGKSFASEGSRRLEGFRRAAKASENRRQWEQIANLGSVRGLGWKIIVPPRTVAYYMRPREVWARAYAQHVAIRSRNPRLLRELRQRQRYGLPLQWSDRDFRPISREIDKLLRGA